jgi:hypothetical protein
MRLSSVVSFQLREMLWSLYVQLILKGRFSLLCSVVVPYFEFVCFIPSATLYKLMDSFANREAKMFFGGHSLFLNMILKNYGS